MDLNIETHSTLMSTDGMLFLTIGIAAVVWYFLRRSSRKKQEQIRKVNAELERVLSKVEEEDQTHKF
ncbi:MAG: hypothetical protein HQM13_09725 [SAR324 cluster bacterium]|nr:hypothetical protein [SAR324 cluster bacterium]